MAASTKTSAKRSAHKQSTRRSATRAGKEPTKRRKKRVETPRAIIKLIELRVAHGATNEVIQQEVQARNNKISPKVVYNRIKKAREKLRASATGKRRRTVPNNGKDDVSYPWFENEIKQCISSLRNILKDGDLSRIRSVMRGLAHVVMRGMMDGRVGDEVVGKLET